MFYTCDKSDSFLFAGEASLSITITSPAHLREQNSETHAIKSCQNPLLNWLLHSDKHVSNAGYATSVMEGGSRAEEL